VNTFGRLFRVSLFGESHGAGVGVLVDGVPPCLPVDEDRLKAALAARRPGTSLLVSQRKEPDEPRLLSGVLGGHATGAPLCVWIENQDAQSKPYRDLARTPRPGHADWVNLAWSQGHADLRGGGHSSGRLTAGLVAAGALAEAILEPAGVSCGAHIHQVGPDAGPAGKADVAAMARAAKRTVPTAHKSLAKRFEATIEAARRAGDSVGGVVEFRAEGLPVGLGDPIVDALESTLAHLLFAVPAVKGVSFGAGFASSAMHGSEHNDPFLWKGGKVTTKTNHAGGILGGRSTGAPLWGHMAVKPASSIFVPQDTVDLQSKRAARLELTGRHDPCIALRAVPVAKACVAIALADALLVARSQGVPGTGP
jgi:chorismate synthase